MTDQEKKLLSMISKLSEYQQAILTEMVRVIIESWNIKDSEKNEK